MQSELGKFTAHKYFLLALKLYFAVIAFIKNICLSVGQLNFLIVFFSLHISDKDEPWSHCDFVPHLFVLVT